ncbi:methyltransferase [Lithospermum erythrorhizon]|uniref:Methyltransferase n=1 Tax=Lithospermum erythrorhizon TaxID=34254 RepID=A0AAV3PTN7_LITER
MLVPLNRETDWTFSTFSGHLQLLLTLPHLSRLILVSNWTNYTNPISYKMGKCDFEDDLFEVEASLMPVMLALAPELGFYRDGEVSLAPKLDFCRSGEVSEVPFLRYEDEVVEIEVLEIFEGSIVGEMLVEDVVLRFGDGEKGFRRRLRFKRMPNLVQSQMRICRNNDDKLNEEKLELKGGGERFLVDDRVLVQPYLEPMVAGMMVIGGWLDGRIRDGLRPKALCLGVGGGALVRFLNSQMGFEVFGVEEDETVLQVGRKYFGLESSESIHLCVGDAIETIKKLAYRDSKWNGEVSSGYCKENGWCYNRLASKFDVIMVDMDSSDAKLGTCAPPLEFIRKSVLLAAKTILSDFGALIINVIPPTKSLYEKLINELREFFAELYVIDVGNEENFVLIASVSDGTASGDCANAFTIKVRSSVSESYIDSIRKISNSVN